MEGIDLHPDLILTSTLKLFDDAFKAAHANRNSLLKELKAAQEKYPILILTYKLTAMYSRFLVKSYRYMSRPFWSEGPIDHFPLPPIEYKDIFQQLEEYTEALLEAAGKVEETTPSSAFSCTMIKQYYKGALDCVEEYLKDPPQPGDEDWDNYLHCLNRLAELAAAMESSNCKL